MCFRHAASQHNQNEMKTTDLWGNLYYVWQISSDFNTGGATSCILCGSYEIMLFEKGVGPKLAASDQQIIIRISCIVS